MNLTDFQTFLAVDIRTGRIIDAKPFPEAKKPAYQLTIDFGPEIGIKYSSAQITHHYTVQDLQNKIIMAVVNFPPKQIANFLSEVLVLGFADQDGHIFLASVDENVLLGARLH